MKRTVITAFCRLGLTLSIAAVALSAWTSACRSQGKWKFGPPSSTSYFPIAVWLQEPSLASRYKSAGINLFVGLWQGPTNDQLADLKAAQMPVICEMNAVGKAHLDDETIVGWMHQDEPDNAQPVKDPVTGREGYGPFVPPSKIVDEYEKMKAEDPSRPIILNLGQGVANDGWLGRGNGAKLSDYEEYVKGGDLISFDVYPVAGLGEGGDNLLWYVPKGVDRLRKWTAGRAAVWNCIECTRIDGSKAPSPGQVRAEVWMSIIHGSRGLIYFVHQFKPRFDAHALLDDPDMLAVVTAINLQIKQLAPAINSRDIVGQISVASSNNEAPIDMAQKQVGEYTYVFAVGMRNSACVGTFTLPSGVHPASIEVLDEKRTISLKGATFTDPFHPYEVHLYRFHR